MASSKRFAERTVVSFEAPGFNTTERRPYFINDCCYGDDVVRELIKLLQRLGAEASGEEPGQEDFGWYAGFVLNGQKYFVVVGRGERAWVVWLERQVNFVGRIFGLHNRKVHLDAVSLLHQAIQRLPCVADIAWYRASDVNFTEAPARFPF